MINPELLEAKNFSDTQTQLARRGFELTTEVADLAQERQQGIARVDSLRGTRNALSSQVGTLMSQGNRDGAQPLIQQSQDLGREISAHETALRETLGRFTAAQLDIPNLPAPPERTPDGLTEDSNEVRKVVGRKPRFNFTPRDHVELGERLGIIDTEAGAQLAGSRFSVLRREGALLSRGLTNLMIDSALAKGYELVSVPQLVNQSTMQGTGQLPKFEDDLFKTTSGLYLVPTAEVPVTNLHAGQHVPSKDLPIALTAATECFRSEAGSAGRDTRGILRQHQFTKVELVQFVEPKNSEATQEAMIGHAEDVLDKLGLHYRRVALCAGDISFAATATTDLEVWLPGQDKFREVSSVSDMTDFQTRRMKTTTTGPDGKRCFPHSLNGSALAVGRTLIAVLEQNQRPDGSVRIPEALQPYVGGLKVIKPRS